MDKELLQLEQRVSSLKDWKASIERERLNFPIDSISDKIIKKGVIVYNNNIRPAIFSLLNDLMVVCIGIKINGKKRFVVASTPLFSFTANAGTDFITNTGGAHNLADNEQISLATTGTLPGGLSAGGLYYVINRTNTTFQLSVSSGGSAIDIVDAGTGTHYWGKVII